MYLIKNAKIYAPEYLGIEYAKNYGGYIDLTTSSDPDFLDPDEVKASTGLKMALDAGVDADMVLAEEATLELLSVFAKGVLMIHEKEVLVKGTFE